jgi:hypothetical protein
VAELIYSGTPKIDTKKCDVTNERDFGCSIKLLAADWDSPKAAGFRKFFKSLEASGKVSNPGNEEHRIESLVLTEMAKTKDKALPYMKPVTIGGLRFPMPTPLRASDHKNVSDAGQYGGGIDVFARAGTGGVNTTLCIMELKDENVPSEPPKDVIKQALVYTVFIRELLRSKSGEAWWHLFGFSGKIPDKLTLFTVCVMPSNANNDVSFKGEELNIGGEDTAMLHYIYFTESGNRITNVEKSLN